MERRDFFSEKIIIVPWLKPYQSGNSYRNDKRQQSVSFGRNPATEEIERPHLQLWQATYRWENNGLCYNFFDLVYTLFLCHSRSTYKQLLREQAKLESLLKENKFLARESRLDNVEITDQWRRKGIRMSQTKRSDDTIDTADKIKLSWHTSIVLLPLRLSREDFWHLSLGWTSAKH